MKKKIAKVSAASLITLSMAVGNVTAINGINETDQNDNEEVLESNTDQNNETSSQEENKVVENETEEVAGEESQETTTVTEDADTTVETNESSIEERKVIGQNTFVDEYGNVKTVDVRDGTTGETYNPNSRTVTTANMVNFNCAAAGTVIEYTDYNTGQAGYLSKTSAADAAFLGYENGKVKFMISGVVGLIDASKVEVVSQGTYYASNYEVNNNGRLYHYISNNVNATGNEGNYNYVGTGPSYLQKNVEYYSYDGHYFYTDYNTMITDYQNNVRSNSVNPNNPYYNYFQYLPLRSKTNYTGAQITNYINNRANSSTSKLNNTGDLFIKYQNQYGVNALLSASVAILESGWGKSDIAISKNNLYGLNAVDSSPTTSADTFGSVEECIADFSKNWMSSRYLNPTYSSNYRGAYFGDKGSGIFNRYSSDVYEGEKCASIASTMDASISGADLNYYTIGIKDVSSTSFSGINVKKEANNSSTTLYTTIKNPAYAFIVRKKQSTNGYYEVQSDATLADNRNSTSTTADYNYANNYGFISANSITIVNTGNDVTYSDNNTIEELKITNAEITNVTKNGYTVTCTVNDASQVNRVMMPTWSANNDQDDLVWYQASQSGNTFTINISTANHKNDSGVYNTHIYVYDNNGNTQVVTLNTTVPVNQAPVISNIEVSDVTSKGYKITFTAKDNDGSIDRIQMPTWSDENWQDDIKWYTPTKNGDTYTLEVKTSNHNYNAGIYHTHIYVYDDSGAMTGTPIDNINVPEAGYPLITGISISDVDRTGYTVTCTVTSEEEIDRVEFPTWTEKNGQDDIIYARGTIEGNTVTYRVNTKDHNAESGIYNTHIYAYTKSGKSAGAQAPKITVPVNQAPVISNIEVSDVTSKGYKITFTAKDNDGSIDRIQMPTWSDENWQDDIKWYTPTKNGDTYTLEVKTSNHNYNAGIYHTHIYVYDDSGAMTGTPIDNINVPEAGIPQISNVRISDVDRTGYTVTCTVTSEEEIDRVEFPTWTEKNGQDDIIYARGTIEGNTVTYRVNTKDHNAESGIYNTHIYAYTKSGKSVGVQAPKITIENDQPSITNVVVQNIDTDSYKVTCYVSDYSSISKVEFPTWTENNGQDDLIWHEGTIDGNTASVIINRSDHNYEYERYNTHIYAYDDEGLANVFATTVDLEEPELSEAGIILKDVTITDANDDGYTVNVTVLSDAEIFKVEFPTWTYKNGQDDIIWGIGEKNGDRYSYRVSRSEHNYEFGAYITHIYAYTTDARVKGIPLSIHNIVNTTVRQGWAYIDGQKYFFDNDGNIAGNMPAKKIIDVSSYNGTIDWNTVKQYGDIDGVILRITAHPNGSYIEDTSFARNLSECRRLNIPFGVYIYDYANNTSDAIYEANFVINILRKYNVSPSELSYPVYYDLERTQISKEQNIANMNAFISTMNANGYTAHVYSYRAMLNDTLNDPSIWANVSWMAAYTNTIGWSNPYYHGNFGWQYTSSGTIPGINGSVDISCWYTI